MKLLKIINPEGVTKSVANRYPVRETVRAVVLDQEGKVALLYVARDKYYKLPGGGMEGAESFQEALKRECMEEIGCDIEVKGEIGTIEEYRKFCSLRQVSYCYRARVKGEKGEPNLMEDEIEEGFEVVWVPFQEGIKLLETCEAIGLEGKSYIVPRDTLFLTRGGVMFGKELASLV